MSWRRHAYVIWLAAALATVPGTPSGAAAPDAQRLLGEAGAAEAGGDLARAAALYARAARLAPRDAEIYHRWAKAESRRGNYDSALQAAEAGLRIEPHHTGLRLIRAQVLAWEGRYPEADRAVAAVIAEHPGDEDAWIVAGRIAFYQRRLDTAEEAFTEARRLNPASTEAARGLADVARARGGNPRAPSAAVEEGPPHWRADLGYRQSRLSRGAAGTWHEAFMRLEHRWPSGWALSVRADMNRRPGGTDGRVGAGVAWRRGSVFHAYAEGAATPSADFLPRWEVAAGGSAQVLRNGDIVGPTVLGIDLTHRTYETGRVETVNPGIQQYLLNGRLWVTGRWVNTFDQTAGERLTGWFGRIDWQVLPALRLHGGLSDAPEADDGVVTDTESRFAGLSTELMPGLRLNLDLVREARENSYVRHTYGTGLTVSF